MIIPTLNPEQGCMDVLVRIVIENIQVKFAVVLINEFTSTKEI